MNSEQQQQPQPVESFLSLAKGFILAFGGIFALGVLLAFFILISPVLSRFADLLGYYFLFLFVVGTAGALWYVKKHQDVSLEIKRQQARLVKANANNVFPAVWLEDERRFVQAINGPQPQQVPAHYSPTISEHHHNDVGQFYKILELAQQQAGQQALLPSPQERALPSIELFYDKIRYNSLQTGMGVDLLTGEPVLLPIRKSTHFKLIGGSGMGKSCVAGSILDIATTTNDPDHLKIGLLDLEHNTSRLFENLPHVAEIGPRKQRLVGRDADEVAQKLQLLQWELKRRSDLGEEYCTQHEPVLLVYVEEMLALKYEVADIKLKKDMQAALVLLAIRGRKYGIFFLACMQTDYADKSTNAAMAQFRTRAGFAIDPDTARASGFFNLDLIKQNFQAGRSGQFVLEKPQYSSLTLAPDYDVALKLEQLSSASRSASNVSSFPSRVSVREEQEAYPEAPGEAVDASALRPASRANWLDFTSQEQRYIRKFQEGMTAGQIVSSEFTNSKGEPLTSGDKFMQRNKEVQEVLRKYMNVEAS